MRTTRKKKKPRKSSVRLPLSTRAHYIIRPKKGGGYNRNWEKRRWQREN